MNETAALDAATHLVLGAAAGNPANIPDAVLLSFIVDDDDGNLANGTPHFRAIAAAADARCPVEAVLFVHYVKDATTPVLRELGRAEAGARLYVASLNALAHPHRGMDAVARIAARVSSFALDAAGLRDTCDMVRRLATGMRAPAAAAADNSRSDNSC